MTQQQPAQLTFTCVDRLKEKRALELPLDSSSGFNRSLIVQLEAFQTQINTLMTEFVDKEKEAIANKTLINKPGVDKEWLEASKPTAAATAADTDASDDDEEDAGGAEKKEGDAGEEPLLNLTATADCADDDDDDVDDAKSKRSQQAVSQTDDDDEASSTNKKVCKLTIE